MALRPLLVSIALCLLASLFTSEAAEVSVNLRPVAWEAKQTMQIEAKERTFENAGAKLSGTLYLPKVRVKVPAAVVTHAACPGGPT